MSFKPQGVGPIPEATVRVAHAAFPKGNAIMRLRDALGPIYTDEQFRTLFPHDGQPALSPGLLALVTVVLATWDIRSEESETCATKIGNGQASDQCICRYPGNWAERCYLLLVRGRKQGRKYNHIHSS